MISSSEIFLQQRASEAQRIRTMQKDGGILKYEYTKDRVKSEVKNTDKKKQLA